MDSLIERIEENKLDALYLFINETLRDRQVFDRSFESLVSVLPLNWSINRVELGHEYLSMVDTPEKQKQLFDVICGGLESLRTIIISDGYVPRKDHGCVNSMAFLNALPKCKNLQVLDLHRIHLENNEQVELLADFFETQESLEDIRLTGLILSPSASLDPAIEACCEMPHLRSLSIGGSHDIIRDYHGRPSVSCTQQQSCKCCKGEKKVELFTCLTNLLQSSSTLQDLSLRSMNLDDNKCAIIAKALSSNGTCFLTSLDIRQNENITRKGYSVILNALERNYDLWCSVLVDDDRFQGKFNSLIVMNQANRGDLIRSPTKEKLVNFLDNLKGEPTALFHFLTIHDNVLYPLVNFLQWKSKIEKSRKEKPLPQQPSLQQQQLLPQQPGCPTSIKRPIQELQPCQFQQHLQMQQGMMMMMMMMGQQTGQEMFAGGNHTTDHANNTAKRFRID